MFKLIDKQVLDSLTEKAKQSPRKRAHHNLHPALDDSVQRLCIAAEPGSYFRPNRHVDPETWEIILVLRGSFVILIFDDNGTVLERFVLSASGGAKGVELPSGTWHALESLETGSIFFEVKQGPYTPIKEKDFASWAPLEGHSAAAQFEAWYRIAAVGDAPPVYRA
jgi:cupin fold WbuC family metalloprotein